MSENSVYQEVFNNALALHKKGKLKDALDLYNKLLNRGWNDNNLRFVMADAYLRLEHNGLAINLLKMLLQDDPQNSNAWCNLGVGFRKENFKKDAEHAWKQALNAVGDTAEVCSNMAGLYADSGEPKRALYWCNKALRCEPGSANIEWQKSLALLTMGNFKDGWRCYQARQKQDTWDSRKTIKAPMWGGEELDRDQALYLHGEQGVGDEIMFLGWLDLVLSKAGNVTVEVNPKVAKLVRACWPSVKVVTTEEDGYRAGTYAYKLPIGSLPHIFLEYGINGSPYIEPPVDMVEHYRKAFEHMGPKPWVALTWLGGAKATNVQERSMHVENYRPLMHKFTCVSGQYEDVVPVVGMERVQAGLVKFDDDCIGGDLLAQAAMFKACDYVVTVAQTALHVAGAVGTKCYVLLPENPDWRYGLEDVHMPFYKSVHLVRRERRKDWPAQVKYVKEAIEVASC